MKSTFGHFVCRVLIASMIVLPLQASAGLVATGDAVADAQRSQTARATIENQLQAHGLSPQAAKERAAALADTEAVALAGRIESLPAGAGGQAIGFLVILAFLLWRFVFSEQAQAEAVKPKPASAPEKK